MKIWGMRNLVHIAQRSCQWLASDIGSNPPNFISHMSRARSERIPPIFRSAFANSYGSYCGGAKSGNWSPNHPKIARVVKSDQSGLTTRTFDIDVRVWSVTTKIITWGLAGKLHKNPHSTIYFRCIPQTSSVKCFASYLGNISETRRNRCL